jgi:hypothetical protein
MEKVMFTLLSYVVSSLLVVSIGGYLSTPCLRMLTVKGSYARHAVKWLAVLSSAMMCLTSASLSILWASKESVYAIILVPFLLSALFVLNEELQEDDWLDGQTKRVKRGLRKLGSRLSTSSPQLSTT